MSPKKIMRLLPILLCILVCAGCVTEPPLVESSHQNPAEKWITPTGKIPDGLAEANNQIPDKHFYECKIAQLGTAINRLKKVSFIELSDGLAEFYAGHSYRPRKGTTAYLVRGALANFTGEFTLYFNDGNLLIQHHSLGRNAIPQFCPLIVQLPKPPKMVLIQIGGAI